MNKKGDLDGPSIAIIAGCILLFVLLFVYLPVDFYYGGLGQNKACQDLEMEHEYYDEKNFCVDEEGNANYVIFDCKGIFWKKECKAKLISIGDLRVEVKNE